MKLFVEVLLRLWHKFFSCQRQLWDVWFLYINCIYAYCILWINHLKRNWVVSNVCLKKEKKRKKRRRRKETVSQYIQTLLQKRCGDNDNNKIWFSRLFILACKNNFIVKKKKTYKLHIHKGMKRLQSKKEKHMYLSQRIEFNQQFGKF